MASSPPEKPEATPPNRRRGGGCTVKGISNMVKGMSNIVHTHINACINININIFGVVATRETGGTTA